MATTNCEPSHLNRRIRAHSEAAPRRRARMDANLVASWSTTDGVPSQSSFEQAATEHACRALFEEWIDLDDTLHRASCVPDPAQPLVFARSPPLR
eukprot:scaffold27434_cov50-Phaeocystis_antarctica.AAC.2